jgi:hypothetical protein
MRRLIRPLIVAGIVAASLPGGLLSATANAATTRPAAPAVPAAAKAQTPSLRTLNRLVAEHKLIRIPLSKLRHGTAFRPASQFRHARRPGAVPAVAAAPTCVGFACTGVDPVNQSNCSVGGYPVSGYTKTISGLGTIRLMYQGSCQANWGEADGASTSAWITAYDVVGGFEYEIPPYNLSPYNYGWTSMVDGQVNAAACIGFAGQTPHCVVQPGLPSEPAVWVS